MISLQHICPSKVRAYNSKEELKVMYVLLLVCSLTCRYIFWKCGGGGGGYKGIRGGGAGIRGGGAGIRRGGAGIRGGGVGIWGGGIQHQEYIMTFNEVLNTIAHNW